MECAPRLVSAWYSGIAKDCTTACRDEVCLLPHVRVTPCFEGLFLRFSRRMEVHVAARVCKRDSGGAEALQEVLVELALQVAFARRRIGDPYRELELDAVVGEPLYA